ncbi:hypothetical protein AB1Y20_015808 [Prymnesium parvum]|uniref:Exostosin GT47 domain-containing protein n=1 Tax=Prymnesium parvum TaxID=97485 RepID=A0AB34K230_PRYPA
MQPLGIEQWPPSLRTAAPLMQPAALSAATQLFSSPSSPPFRVYLDETCRMPSHWSERWRDWNSTAKPRAPAVEAKYIADAYLLHMLAASPFRVADWRDADAMVVVLLAREFGGAGLAPERCRRKLSRESEAWRRTEGARHFFILTSDRGPCCNGGQLLHTAFLRHHVIGHHGELDGHHWRHGAAPDVPCFHSHKDISIPTPSAALPAAPRRGAARDLLLFYAGAGLTSSSGRQVFGMREGRKLLHEHWGNASRHPDVRVLRKASPAEYLTGIARARFCPIMGGYAPWTPRLSEAMLAGCVPVLFSSLLPPFSRVLDWSRLAVRVRSLHEIPRLRAILAAHDHARLASNLAAVRPALWYRLEGGYRGDDMLPLLLVEMHMALQAAARQPLASLVPRILGAPLRDAPAPRRWRAAGSNHSFLYEGQTVIRTFHGAVERRWDCAYLTSGVRPLHAKDDDPEQTYEVGNASRTAPVVSAGCACVRGDAISAEPVSPTQRDLGPSVCTSPCPEPGGLAAFDPAAAWCGPDSVTGQQGSVCEQGCTRKSCTVYGGVVDGPWNRLSIKVHTYVGVTSPHGL